MCCLLVIATATLVGASSAQGSNWTLTAGSGSAGEGQAQPVPAAPSASASCYLLALQITVSWSAVTHAGSYSVYESTKSSSGPFTVAASGLTTTSWTSPALATGTYWFEVTATLGTSWTTSASAATAPHTVTLALCT